MRWMRAAAIVTINGWETIENRFDVPGIPVVSTPQEFGSRCSTILG